MAGQLSHHSKKKIMLRQMVWLGTSKNVSRETFPVQEQEMLFWKEECTWATSTVRLILISVRVTSSMFLWQTHRLYFPRQGCQITEHFLRLEQVLPNRTFLNLFCHRFLQISHTIIWPPNCFLNLRNLTDRRHDPVRDILARRLCREMLIALYFGENSHRNMCERAMTQQIRGQAPIARKGRRA